MKKVLFLFYIILSFLWFSLAATSWQLETIETSEETNQEKVISDYDYIYFHSDSCSYCQKLEEYFNKNDIYEKYDIKKVDVQFDKEGVVFANEVWEENNVPQNHRWTPFFLFNDNDDWNIYYTVWEPPVRKYFQALESWDSVETNLDKSNQISFLPELSPSDEENSKEASSSQQFIMIIIVMIIWLLIIVFTIYNPFEKKNS